MLSHPENVMFSPVPVSIPGNHSKKNGLIIKDGCFASNKHRESAGGGAQRQVNLKEKEAKTILHIRLTKIRKHKMPGPRR